MQQKKNLNVKGVKIQLILAMIVLLVWIYRISLRFLYMWYAQQILPYG